MTRNLKARLFTLAVVLLVAYLSAKTWTPEPQPAPISPPVVAASEPAPEVPAGESIDTSATSPQASTAKPKSNPPANVIVRNVTIRDRDGNKVFTGDIDLTATVQRIDAGHKLPFPNDGIVFQNRERRLPNKSSGHYREWVHPTPDLSGPGPQRVVTGQAGEAFYTHDHYRTFKKIR